MGKLCLLVNPNAGRGSLKHSLLDIITLFHGAGWDVTVLPTHQSGDAVRYMQERYGEFDLTVCCGGDGTLNETITGLLRQPLPVKLGYIPVGTANDLATSLRLKKNPLEAAKDILEMRPFLHDVGCFNDQFFTYIAAFGTFSNISYATPQPMKRSLGKLAYVLQAVLSINDIKPRHARLVLDGEVIEGDFVVGAVMNSSSFAGLFKLKPEQVKLDDGIFEVLLIKPPKNPMHVKKMMDQLIHRQYDANDIRLYHARDITITTKKDTPWCLDGELGGYYETVHIHAHDRQITFYAGTAGDKELQESSDL